MLAAPEPPRLALVSGTRSGRGPENRRLFLVDFTGEGIAAPGDLQVQLSAGSGAIPSNIVYRYPERDTLRVAFELDPKGEKSCELRLNLQRAGAPLTETWLYRWTP